MLLDQITADWPNCVVAQFKNGIDSVEADGEPVGWLALEQRFVSPPPPP